MRSPAAKSSPVREAQISTATSAPSVTVMTTLQHQVQQLQQQVQEITSQPSALQRATEIRQLRFQEELLKLEKSKIDLQRENLEVQKKILVALDSIASQTLLKSMWEQ